MSKIRVICPNHGIVQTIEQDAMWVGKRPSPHYFCPKCGAKTVVEHPRRPQYKVYVASSKKEQDEAKQREIDYYKKKYFSQGGER